MESAGLGINDVITTVWDAVGQVFTLFTSHPIALIPVGIGLASGAIALGKRLIRK